MSNKEKCETVVEKAPFINGQKDWWSLQDSNEWMRKKSRIVIENPVTVVPVLQASH